ncbi:MAG TPA: type II toxin-antitoxin system VapC family toxin [Candidatus Saccharimonadales bacterium]|nr:type II toxin-antitoxin system VapC family toxin [Candidatus Saccharimonadales bacterium]
MTDSRLLIDSHILVWLLYEPEKISPEAQNLLQVADAVYLSSVSLWELALKFNKHKLAYSPKELIAGAEELSLDRLSLRDQHILSLDSVELSHKDPFDALLVAQSEAEGCVFMTADSRILDSSHHTFKC